MGIGQLPSEEDEGGGLHSQPRNPLGTLHRCLGQLFATLLPSATSASLRFQSPSITLFGLAANTICTRSKMMGADDVDAFSGDDFRLLCPARRRVPGFLAGELDRMSRTLPVVMPGLG